MYNIKMVRIDEFEIISEESIILFFGRLAIACLWSDGPVYANQAVEPTTF
jgi:hypothetical protein